MKIILLAMQSDRGDEGVVRKPAGLAAFARFRPVTAIGTSAGGSLTSGSSNIYIGKSGTPSASNTIRIGTVGTQTATYVAGISGATVSGVGVLVSGTGLLGVAASSRTVQG